MISPYLLIIILLPVIGVYFLGFFVGKKSGYIKRLKEEEQKTETLNS